MVTIKTLDRFVGALIVVTVGVGLYSVVQAALFTNPTTGMMGMMPRTSPIWYFFGTLLTASVVAGIYLASRDRLRRELSHHRSDESASTHDPSDDSTDDEPGTGGQEGRPADATPPVVLDYLPEDERQVLEPILDTPGLTQVELRGRAGYSKAKVSQTVSELEDRGLIFRERQGRTYRVYPGEILKDATD